MEFIIVIYPETRGVLIDGTRSGETNETLMVDEGHHEFKLDGNEDYTPLSQEVLVQNTDPDDPMKIFFTPIDNGGQRDDE
jgi:hypothetical protein